MGRRALTLPAEIVLVQPDDIRGASRRVVNFGAFVRDSAVVALKVRVKDLSTDGCRVSGLEELEGGSEIWLKITGLAPMRARVAWVSAGEAGCEFSAPLNATTLEELLVPKRRITKGVFGAIAPRLGGAARR